MKVWQYRLIIDGDEELATEWQEVYGFEDEEPGRDGVYDAVYANEMSRVRIDLREVSK